MAAGKSGMSNNIKLIIALGLFVVAGVVIFLQLRSGDGDRSRAAPAPKVSQEEQSARMAEHERQVKAAEQAQRQFQATSGGAN
jgi:flagellar basal body-associated protein FliL